MDKVVWKFKRIQQAESVDDYFPTVLRRLGPPCSSARMRVYYARAFRITFPRTPVRRVFIPE
jgi:hypothetical protein